MAYSLDQIKIHNWVTYKQVTDFIVNKLNFTYTSISVRVYERSFQLITYTHKPHKQANKQTTLHDSDESPKSNVLIQDYIDHHTMFPDLHEHYLRKESFKPSNVSSKSWNETKQAPPQLRHHQNLPNSSFCSLLPGSCSRTRARSPSKCEPRVLLPMLSASLRDSSLPAKGCKNHYIQFMMGPHVFFLRCDVMVIYTVTSEKPTIWSSSPKWAWTGALACAGSASSEEGVP